MDEIVDRPQKTLGTQGMNLQQVRLSDIKLATGNFSEASKFFVSGDGCAMYRAEVDYKDGHSKTILIKRYPPQPHVLDEEEFFTDIEMLASVKHHNIVTPIGYCFEGSEMILVTENIANGYLGHYLGNFNNMLRNLTWEKRLKICIDVARALCYLHYEMEDQRIIINCDINCYNIGLDENFRAKIVDFWYSVSLPPNQQDEALYRKWRGRTSYVDPEYEKTDKLKRESDVYSFGVVLFEILCGRKSIDPIYTNKSEKGLAPLARQSFSTGTLEHMMDPMLKEETYENNFVLNRGPNKDSLHTFIEIANQCVAETQDQRPTMKIVVKKLEKALFFQKHNKDNHRMSLEDIKQATQDFHNDNFIGGGGFGKVYKGNIQDGDRLKTVVAKRLNTKNGQGEHEFLIELQILLEYKHENIIGLLGYCDEKDEKIIVCEYAPKGSLDRHLNNASLTWVKRLNICIDVASALSFLHGGVEKQAKVIHRDIKPANILLNRDWKAKLADFGLSLISPLIQETDYVIDQACGTYGYLDPIYEKSGFLTIESDIYSFGVVLFEILCGRSTFAVHKHEGHYLPNFIKNKLKEGKLHEVVFEQIRKQIVPKSLTTFQEIASQCLYHEREKRPTTKKVLVQLKKALELQNMPSTMTKFASLHIPLEDIVKATNNFHVENIIHHDEYVTTYKGRLSLSRKEMKIVARRFDCKHGEGDLKFLMEISMLSDLKHNNLVCIIGFCDEKDEKIIVTKYEPKGSLGQYLTNPNLTWTQRLKISVGMARVLSYFHHEEGRDYAIIHCNINSDTILLDANWEAKLSGFEFSIKQLLDHKDEVNLCEHIDTMGYMDPSIEKTGGVTHKSDIYSFGVVLFEMLCWRKSFIQSEANRFLAPLVRYHSENKTLRDIIHDDLKDQMSPHSFVKYVTIAYSCLNEEPTHRPDADYIVARLEKALELQLRHENIGKKLKHLKICLSDINSATDNFSEMHKFSVGYYYAWYRSVKCIIPREWENKDEPVPKRHNTVVIKRLIPNDDERSEQVFFTEIEVLSSVKHTNIVTLIGFCVEGPEMILVIENVSNVSLGTYLENLDSMRLLTWERRLKICIDVAHALNYLHSEMQDKKMIILRKICSYDILLDESFGAKIAWLGYSVVVPLNQEDDYPCFDMITQTRYYIDPEYKTTRKLKRGSDVYSFGVLLFEILCGRLANDPIYLKEDDEGLTSMARQSFRTGTLEEMIDPIIKEETCENNFVLNIGPNKDSLHTFIELAHQCVAETRDQRPTMKAIVKELEKALFFQENNKDNPRISLEDIKRATQNFHDDNCIGGEGFEKVYKGNLQDGDGFNTIVAKRLDWRSGQGLNQFLSELQILWEYKHENVIGLVGYCDEHDENIIVFEYASRGSLDRYLDDTSLTWIQRLNICIDVASALDFIHGVIGKQVKVIYRDIKTSNILLNHEWKAKLADFGLSIISPISMEKDCVTHHVCGTKGYMDPLHGKSGSLTIESDIYSFGVVLFEILCGRSTFAIHEQEGHYLANFIKNKFEEGKHEEAVFEQIREYIDPNSLAIFQKIAYQCLHQEREKRPTTKEILSELKRALEFQLCDPA